MEFAKGRDVFVSLPTGYGKSLCYVILPSVFDELRKSDKKSIVLVVSPLIALMKDQVDSINAMGLSAIHISDRQFISTTVKQSVKHGEYQLIFISPEALICCMEWRSMLSTKIYQKNLVAFVIDEANCIKKWYVGGCGAMTLRLSHSYQALSLDKSVLCVCMHYVGVTVSGWSSLILEKSGALFPEIYI